MPQTAWFCYFLVYLICLFSLVSPSTHRLPTRNLSFSFIKKLHQPSVTTHLTPAQRAEVHAALNELSRVSEIDHFFSVLCELFWVYTEHQATTTTANSNRKQQPSQPINEPSNNTVESKTDQLASNASDSNATSVPPTPVLQPADIPVLTANHATIASNPPPAYNPIPTIHQRIAEHNQIFDQQVEEIIDPNVKSRTSSCFHPCRSSPNDVPCYY
ncbi:hypothetical protein PSTT_09454 [Puccinia striiformis]|uniref:Uncharacterized protein n=1 Tax=Puccinia striiformis TaxID=27350 RepID=A0A2S4V846_9BASI|nr:hypothetical protein PSTT_09454 [Puccinia striiformis]